jgi:hypothetical protein
MPNQPRWLGPTALANIEFLSLLGQRQFGPARGCGTGRSRRVRYAGSVADPVNCGGPESLSGGLAAVDKPMIGDDSARADRTGSPTPARIHNRRARQPIGWTAPHRLRGRRGRGVEGGPLSRPSPVRARRPAHCHRGLSRRLSLPAPTAPQGRGYKRCVDSPSRQPKRKDNPSFRCQAASLNDTPMLTEPTPTGPGSATKGGHSVPALRAVLVVGCEAPPRWS